MLAERPLRSKGLVPAIAQQHDTGEVLMMAWMDRNAVVETMQTGRACYWSRSRKAPWRKGDTSGHIQTVIDFRVDCDGDTVLCWSTRPASPVTPDATTASSGRSARASSRRSRRCSRHEQDREGLSIDPAYSLIGVRISAALPLVPLAPPARRLPEATCRPVRRRPRRTP